jgi:hypothetical protein
MLRWNQKPKTGIDPVRGRRDTPYPTFHIRLGGVTLLLFWIFWKKTHKSHTRDRRIGIIETEGLDIGVARRHNPKKVKICEGLRIKYEKIS